MIEVLITAMVLSLGLLGLAALQVTVSKNTFSAGKRSEATVLAYNIFDRMRTNRNAALDGDYTIDLGDAATGTGTLAERDLNQWKARLSTALPSGDGSVATTGNLVTVTIQWDDSYGASGVANQQFVFEARL